MSEYRKISNFGSSLKPVNGLEYCMFESLNNTLEHGSGASNLSTKYGARCQAYMSTRCSNKWDDVCEVASQNKDVRYPGMKSIPYSTPFVDHKKSSLTEYTAGQLLVRQTAQNKYASKMSDTCIIQEELLDPTSASSDKVHMVSGNDCVVQYAVNPKTVKTDRVLQKMLMNPKPYMDILYDIYDGMKSQGILHRIAGTKLDSFFDSLRFKAYLKQL